MRPSMAASRIPGLSPRQPHRLQLPALRGAAGLIEEVRYGIGTSSLQGPVQPGGDRLVRHQHRWHGSSREHRPLSGPSQAQVHLTEPDQLKLVGMPVGLNLQLKTGQQGPIEHTLMDQCQPA